MKIVLAVFGAILLLAIVVFVISTAVTRPVITGISHAKDEQTLQTTCLKNMAQLARALSMYLDDNDNRFPAGGCIESLSSGKGQQGDWIWFEGQRRERGPYNYANPRVPTWRMMPQMGSLWEYTNKNERVFTCPSDPHATDADATTLGTFNLSYVMNASIAGCDTGAQRQPARFEDVHDPGTTILITESYSWVRSAAQGNQELPPYDGVFRWTQAVPVSRHIDGGNFLLCNGHARWLNPAQQRRMSYRLDGKADSRQFSCPKWREIQ